MNKEILFYYIHYLGSALSFEGSISICLLLIGKNFLDYNWYYFLSSAFLGGLWSHRASEIYTVMRQSWNCQNSKTVEYFEVSVFGGEGYDLKLLILIVFVILNIFLLFLLYYV